ncbi:putative outer membrane adhesin like protein [Tolumonas auensis DSM 9187]|uniref:Putative outer membrane adhesin like protein n=1 Tax=Tolumonas auensis (strain DSM 9187 / NBRC 110442 / TA 4) TaxID=595494 RepID=C4LE62_TOLAT|nr:retention module-containing protein [Tolumonas auensis]ACQ92883.1 putative outer membrane adhesin like protein [Tolumonas auensis DSM 9187]
MNNQTITEVSRVTFISGAAKVRTPDGELHDLKVGDILQPGTQVILADASIFVVEATSSEVPGAAAPEAVASTELPADQQPSMPGMGAAAGDDVLAQINQLQQAILAGDDPTQAFEAAAAGVAANAGGRGPGSGNSGFIAVDRVGNATIAAAGYETAAQHAAPQAHFDEPAAFIPRGDTTAPLAPTVIITDDVNNDGFLSNAELGNATTVDTRVNLPPDAVVGDTLIITDGITSQTLVLTPDDIAAGFYDTTFARPAEGDTLTVTATVTDAAGNMSDPGSDSAILDTTATAAPTVTITTDGDNNGRISLAEQGSATTDAVRIGIPVTAVAGNTLNMTDGITPQMHVLTAADITNGYYDTTFAKPAEGGTLTVTATVTDMAGNTSLPGSDSAILDITATAAPTVTITTDGDNNGRISLAEQGSATTDAVRIGIPVTAVAGDTLNMTDGITPQTHVLTAADITNGYYDTTFAKPAEGGTLTVTATVTDMAGNTSLPGSDYAVLDTLEPPRPVVTIVDDNNPDDHLLNENELGTDHVQISVDIDEGELANGGYVTLEITSGESRTVELYLANAGDDVLTSRTPGDTHVYAYDAATGIITFTELTPAEGGTVQVEATQTDLAGNESLPGSDYAVLDTLEPPRPVVTIVDDNNPDDHLLNENELGTDHVQISVDIDEGELANGGYVTLEITSGESRTVELYLANAGDDVLTSRTPGDTHVYAYDAATGIITFTELTPAEGGTVQVEATQTDLAGNESLPGSDYAVLDTLEPPRPLVTIVDDNNPDDHLLNENELGTDHVQISVDINEGELANGGYVTLEIISGESRTVELYLANAGDDVLTSRTPGDTHVYAYDAATGIITFTELTPAEGGTVQVEATQTDLAGNESLPGSDYAVLDTLEPPRPLVTIVDDNNPDDHLLNENELGTDHVQISVDINEGELANGGYVTLEIISGESRTVELYLANAGDDVLTSRTPGDTHVYAYDAATGIITFTELTPAEGGTVQVEATQTDLAGNESLPGSDYAVLDTLEPPRPVVTIVDDNNPDDHLLNENELGTDHVQISVDIDEGELANGGYVTLEITSGESRTVELYLANAGDDVLTSRTPGDTHVYAYDAATGIITFTELTPAEGGTVQVEATQTDLAGNESLPGSDYAVLDTLEPPRPLVTIVDDNNPGRPSAE